MENRCFKYDKSEEEFVNVFSDLKFLFYSKKQIHLCPIFSFEADKNSKTSKNVLRLKNTRVVRKVTLYNFFQR